MAKYFRPNTPNTTSEFCPNASALHPADLGRKLAKAGIQVGCWYYTSPATGEGDSGFIGSISGDAVELQLSSGTLWVENSARTPEALRGVLGRKAAMAALASARRRLESRLRMDASGQYREWVLSHLPDGWRGDTPPDGLYFEGPVPKYRTLLTIPPLWREKPSKNGNGWWAGDSLVHCWADSEEAVAAFGAARRRIEDRLRKELDFLLAALRQRFKAAPGPHWGTEPPIPLGGWDPTLLRK